jgi:hypothetical protein
MLNRSELGMKLMQALEKDTEDLETREEDMDDQVELGRELVEKLIIAIQKSQDMKQAKNRKNLKKDQWGSVLVERPRRKKNTGGTVLQQAMELKQRKNLEPIKGNSFSALQIDTLNQIALDSNIRIGGDNEENEKLIDNLVQLEKQQHDMFLNDNPEILLPVNLEVDPVMEVVSFEDPTVQEFNPALADSFKQSDTSDSWTEVVREGRNRNKPKSDK